MAIENNDDQEKVTEIYKQYSGIMLYIAVEILHDIHLAEDAVMEAFIKIIINLKKISSVNCHQTKSFVVIIVRNIAFDILRRKKHNQITFIEDVIENFVNDDQALSNLTIKEACDNILKCINRLNRNYSDILYLKLKLDCSYEEIGKILGISKENAKMRLSRARKALKKELKKEEDFL